MIGLVRRFFRNRSGAPAMEFALVAPMMLFATLGAFDLVELMQANKRIENVAASIADIVSRDVMVMDEELTEIWASRAALMAPLPATGMQVRITSATVVSRSRAQVVWSEQVGGLPRHRPGVRIVVPEPVGRTQTGVVIVTVRHSWTPPMGILSGHTARTVEHTEYRRPRVVDPVMREP